MEPWQSWAIVGAAGAGAYWYYSQREASSKKGGTSRSQPTGEPVQLQRRKAEGSNKKRRDGKNLGLSSEMPSEVTDLTSRSPPSSGNETISKRKGNKKEKQSSNLAVSSAAAVSVPDTSQSLPGGAADEEEMSNREFARQLADVKSGTNPKQSDQQASQPLRTRKLGKSTNTFDDDRLNPFSAAGTDAAGQSSTSSTTGADADDDFSSSNSPVIGASQTPNNAGGVADMLERPSPGHSVLRLTDPVQPIRPKAPKTTSSAQQVETKKQRQNRAKVEAKKLEREEAERQRRVLLEKQRRTAREAEGRPAKNGVPITSPRPPSSPAWNPSSDDTASQPQRNDGIAPPTSDTLQLLDTFEPSPPAPLTSLKPPAASKFRDLPTEQEQMRMLSELDDWQTVEKPRKKDKSAINGGRPATPTTLAGSGTDSSSRLARSIPANKSSKRKVLGGTNSNTTFGVLGNGGGSGSENGDGEGGTGSAKEGKYVPYAESGHPDDSDWPVV
ncbi:hypothetical protein MMC25_007802 [Agyrium rufum]|nr:hypothetical protein [Agyrium rufum]